MATRRIGGYMGTAKGSKGRGPWRPVRLDSGSWLGTRRVGAYLTFVLSAFILIGVVAIFIISSQTHQTGVTTAKSNTAVAARSAENEISGGVSDGGGLVALGFLAEAESVTIPANCEGVVVSLAHTSSTPRAYSIVDPSGRIVCTSVAHPTADYAAAPWLAAAEAPQAASQGEVYGPYEDPLTHTLSLVAAAPVPGAHGEIIVLSQSLDVLGSQLTTLYGGPTHLSFLVTTADNSRIISSSLGGTALSGRMLASTAFVPVGETGSARPGVTGVDSFFSESTISGSQIPSILHWHIYVGEAAATALAASNHLRMVAVWILIFGIVLMSLALVVAYRTVTRPLFALARGLRIPEGRAVPDPVVANGPVEVAAIGTSVNILIEEVAGELERRRAAEGRARESSQRYQALFDSNPLPIVLIDSETLKFIDVNDAAVDAYGYTPLEFRALAAPDLWDDPEGVAQSIHGGEPVDSYGPVSHTRKDGSMVRVLVTSRTISFGGRDVRFSVYEDITEAERMRTAAEQGQRLESLGLLAGGVAHDFNNLLSVIANYAAFIAKSPAVMSDPDTHSDVEQVIRATERASDLTAQLLRFARKEVVRPRALDLNAVVKSVEVLLRRTIGEHITLGVFPAVQLPTVVADPGQLEQVLVNLAVNARDAMPTGGTLTIATKMLRLEHGDRQLAQNMPSGTYVRIDVADTGCGMDKAQIARAFEPFFTTKETGHGTGLGLSTVYGIVTAAGGNVEIESTPGRGTTVSVLLPASTQEAEVSADTAPRPKGPRGAGQRVLVVEDEDAIRQLVERILSQNGYTVSSAANGPEAVALLSRHSEFDLLVTDVVMPLMSGSEVAERARRHLPDLAVLYMSGYAESVLGPAWSVEDGIDLLHKPFSEGELLIKVAAALETRSGAVVGDH
ncbi:MAG TPA: ATP-binding protein [Acidimicrobiales bacterium]|nr:ATP-binding protein [Acidimicrobiales bacterium]